MKSVTTNNREKPKNTKPFIPRKSLDEISQALLKKKSMSS